MITLAEAAARVGDGVVYQPGHGAPEDGVITRVSDRWVFVRYAGDVGSKATRPEDLTFLAR